MDGKLSKGHIPRTQALGSNRFLSLTQPRGILRAATALSPKAPMWAVTAHSPPQCAEAGIVCILTRRRDEEWRGGVGGGIY